jgi:hypothetical protein
VSNPRTSYLVAAIGATKGALAQCFAQSPGDAARAVAALALDVLGEKCACCCIDTGAAPGLWLTGDPAYIRAAIAKATGGAP